MARIFSISVVCLMLLCTSCATTKNSVPYQEKMSQEDLACSYFYFLWGTQAEYNERFPEAMEAYEKALICDEEALYIKEKLPLLFLKMGKFERAAAWLRQAIVDYPENASYPLFLAGLYIQQNQYDEAILIFNKVLEKDPENEGVQIRLGLLYTHRLEFEKAEALFKNVLNRNSDSYFPRLYLARLFKAAQRMEEAAVEYEKALRLNWSKELAFEIGQLYTTETRFIDALRIYTTITDNDQEDERASLARIQTLLDLQRNDEALAALQHIRFWSSDPDKIDLVTSKILLRNNKHDEARLLLEELVKTTQASEPHYMLALLAYQDENYETALVHLDFIQLTDDEFEEAVYLQTRIFKITGHTEQSIAMLKKHLSQQSSSSPLFYALLATLYQESQDFDTAIATLEEAISAYPENHQLVFEYALLLERKGERQLALSTMERVLELAPDHAEALNYIGYTWADQGIHLDKALEYIQRANDLKPNNSYILDSLGWVYYKSGQLDQASEHLERSISLEPNDPHIYSHLGDVYSDLGRKTEALDSYQKAFDLFEDEILKATIKSKIDALEN